MKYDFYPDGQAWGPHSVEILEDHITVEVPEGIAAWRLSFDLKTQKVIIKYKDMNNTDADAQLHVDNALSVEAGKTAAILFEAKTIKKIQDAEAEKTALLASVVATL